MEKYLLVLSIFFGARDQPVLSREIHAVSAGIYDTYALCQISGRIATNTYFPSQWEDNKRATDFLCIPVAQ